MNADVPVLDRPLPYGPPLTLRQAKAIMQAAEAEALAHAWPVAIVVADASASIVLALKVDQTQHSSMAIATGKALTAVNFRRPTSREVGRILRLPEVVKSLGEQGVMPAPTSPADFDRFIASEIERLGRVVKTANISLD